MESIVRELAVELACHGVRVNAVRAGLVEGKVTEFLGTNVTRAVIDRTPLGRLASPEEVASVATFLTGEDASWITGQVIDVDGGFGLV